MKSLKQMAWLVGAFLFVSGAARALKPPPGYGAAPPAKGVMAWDLLADVKFDPNAMDLKPVFGPKIKAMNKKIVVMQGFMMPLDQGRKQKKFILSAMAPSCPYCLPGGPESLVEVRSKTGVNISFDVLKIKGTFTLVTNMEEGIFYRLENAEVAR